MRKVYKRSICSFALRPLPSLASRFVCVHIGKSHKCSLEGSFHPFVCCPRAVIVLCSARFESTILAIRYSVVRFYTHGHLRVYYYNWKSPSSIPPASPLLFPQQFPVHRIDRYAVHWLYVVAHRCIIHAKMFYIPFAPFCGYVFWQIFPYRGERPFRFFSKSKILIVNLQFFISQLVSPSYSVKNYVFLFLDMTTFYLIPV